MSSFEGLYWLPREKLTAPKLTLSRHRDILQEKLPMSNVVMSAGVAWLLAHTKAPTVDNLTAQSWPLRKSVHYLNFYTSIYNSTQSRQDFSGFEPRCKEKTCVNEDWQTIFQQYLGDFASTFQSSVFPSSTVTTVSLLVASVLPLPSTISPC